MVILTEVDLGNAEDCAFFYLGGNMTFFIGLFALIFFVIFVELIKEFPQIIALLLLIVLSYGIGTAIRTIFNF